MTRLRALDARVTCAPFHATLSARSCVARHRARYSKGRNEHTVSEVAAAHPTCAGCPVGAELARGRP